MCRKKRRKFIENVKFLKDLTEPDSRSESDKSVSERDEEITSTCYELIAMHYHL